jgi:tetratricopeptide (TPR) repeat protein
METLNLRYLAMIKGVRNAVIFFLFALLCIQGCKNKGIEGPAIRFESDTYDFGEVKPGGDISYTFSFFNPGSDTLVLERVRSSCSSCTKIDEYDERVAPERRGKITVTYKATSFPRYANNQVYVETNISNDPNITLTVMGRITETPSMVQVIPRALMFGEIDGRDALLNGKVRLRSSFDRLLLITGIIPSNDKVKIKVDTVEEGKEYVINIAVRPPFKKGNRGEEVILKTNLKEKPEIIIPYVYSFNPPKGFKQKIKDKFSRISLRGSFFGRKNDVESRLHQLEKLGEMAREKHESLGLKQGAEQVAVREEFYGLMHKRANMAMKFLTEFSLADLNEDDLIAFLEIADVAKDEQQVSNISKILFEKFPESKSDLNLMKTFFINSCLLEPREVVKYINIDMFAPPDQLLMYYMLALSFSEWGNTEEAMNYTEKAENIYRLINLDRSKRDLIPILEISTAKSFVLKKVGYNERASKVIDDTRKRLSDNNDALRQLGSIERRLNVLGKEALPLGTQHWSGAESSLKISDLKGKVILMEFFTWNCEQSNIDLPYLFRLEEEVNNDDFMIVGVIDYVDRIYQLGLGISTEKEYEHLIDDYREVQKINWTISMSKVALYDYGVDHTPDFILIDKKGIVRDGYFISNYSYLKKKILKLLEES